MNSETLVGQVQSLAFGGQGIVRHEGLVIFVPFTAPGDTIRLRVTKQKKSFAEGELVEVMTPGPERCQPVCPYFGVCGGCQLQHLTYDEQLRQKRSFVYDALKRIGKLRGVDALTITPSTERFGYRRHIRLTLRPGLSGYEAGYVRYDLAGIVPVTQCPIFADPKDPLLPALQELLKEITPVPGEGAHVSVIRAKADRYVLAFQFPDRSPEACAKLLPAWLQQHRQFVSGVMVSDRTSTKSFGDCHGEFDVDGISIQFSPSAFVQCHPEQSLNVYREVLRLAKECSAQSVLDLYCGIGVTSLLLAKAGLSVTGVEGNPEAVRLAGENAKANRISGVDFVKADVARVLPGLLNQLTPDLVLINPPRTGLDPTARERLLAQPIPNIIYISCMPSTLARDLAALQERGYEMKSCRVFDMFPQTTHVETVVWMQLRAQS